MAPLTPSEGPDGASIPQNAELMQASADLTTKLRERFGTPPIAARAFVDTVVGNKGKITESFFQPEELEALREVAETQLNKGKKTIGYGQYGEGGTEEKVFLQNGTEAALTALTDLRSSLAFTLGMANVRREEDGTIVITDKYRWAAPKAKVDAHRGFVAASKLLTQGLVQNGLLGVGNVIGNFVADQDSGRTVEIRIPPK